MRVLARRGAVERSRRRFVRRQWARRWLTWKYVAAVVLVAGLVGGSVYAVYFSATFAVQDVAVSGAEDLATDDVLAVAAVPTGGPLATVDLVAVERRVAALAQVSSVDVTRQWPDDVLIRIEERVPVAVVARGGTLRAVDAEGVVFDSYAKAPEGLPRVETGADADTDALAEAAAVVAALPGEISSAVDHLELISVDEINLELRDGRLVRWGSAAESEQKARVLLKLLPRKARVYDVSVPELPTTS